ncbi:MAG: VOC family protein [Bacteroidetes bacterium]|nr:MAG: VOC family protein [Bacteroidota bacterium]
MKYYISGIQQIGVGVTDVKKSWKWYRENLGFDIPVVDAPGTAEKMLKYTGGQPQERHAIIAVNIQGGGGLEIWQYLTREPKQADFQIQAGDLGVFAAKIKSSQIKKAYTDLKEKKVKLLSALEKDPKGNKHFFFEDYCGNVFQMVENNVIFKKSKALSGGVFGAIIGVSDIEKSIRFYSDVLGYDTIEYHESDVFKDFSGIKRGDKKFDRVLLSHSKPREGAFSKLLGSSQIELIKVYNAEPKKIYEDRFWGDPGFIQICFDVRNMKAFKEHCNKTGFPFTVDSNPEIYKSGGKIFDMGEASGHFTYTEDPDGTLIELVETHKIPIIKKMGLDLNLMKRKPEKALPDWMLKTLAWNRVK